MSVRGILERVVSGSSILSVAEAAVLLRAASSTLDIAAAANAVRERDSGPTVSYVINRNINFSNVCYLKCGFCAFSRTAPESEGYFLPTEEVVRRAKQAHAMGATEVCIQAGLPPGMAPSHYEQLASAVKSALPSIHLHAFSPEEVKHGARLNRLSVADYVARLKAAGVDSLPGTSAEILDDAVRGVIAERRISSGEWREVVVAAHRAGLRTTSTMMFGHCETPEHVAAHLGTLRNIQRDTGGFTEFVPLSFVSAEAPMMVGGGKAGVVREGPLGSEVVRVHAVARLFLSPFIKNIQVSWVKEGLRMAGALLHAGVNDLGGVLMNESISTAAGAGHGQYVRPSTLRRIIRDAGRVPVQRSTLYGKVKAFAAEEEEGEASAEPLESIAESKQDAVEFAFGSYKQLTSGAAGVAKEYSFRAALKDAKAKQGGGACASGATAGGRRAYSTTSSSSSSSSSSASLAPEPAASASAAPSSMTVTVSPCFTLVPTFECFNTCTYCDFKAQGAQDTQDGWLTPSAAAAVLAHAKLRSGWAQAPWREALGGAGLPLVPPGGGPPPPPPPPPVSECLILSGEVAPGSSRRAAWVQRLCQLAGTALEAGLLPHTNAGPLSEAEMSAVFEAGNVSMGLMMEQLVGEGRRLAVHKRAPSKWSSAARLGQLEQAGRLRIPFTTGMLVGIGETQEERLGTVERVGEVAARYGHVGEFILQPLSSAALDALDLPELVRATRARLPPGVVLQIPPNLVVRPLKGGEWDFSLLLACLEAGARDIGGVSPRDEVNSTSPFPPHPLLVRALADKGFSLRLRLPLYKEHYPWVRASAARDALEMWRRAGR